MSDKTTPESPEVRAVQNGMLEIANGVYWLGQRDSNSVFHTNSYLRRFAKWDREPAPRISSLLIDPGPRDAEPLLHRSLTTLLGGPEHVSAVYLNHQDPDVSAATPSILELAPEAPLICSESTWRLVRHLGIPRDSFINISRFHGGLQLTSGHSLVPVPTPFCHFRGAVALYDVESRVLFSGDLFASLTQHGKQSLWADESDWTGIRAFHQLYMPASAALQRAITLIDALNPPPLTIAPQHGCLLRGDMIEVMKSRLVNLPVGLDLLDDIKLDLKGQLSDWTRVLRRVIHSADAVTGGTAIDQLMEDPGLAKYLDFSGDMPRIVSHPKLTFEEALDVLCAPLPQRLQHMLVYGAVQAAEDLNLPTPQIAAHTEKDSLPPPDHDWKDRLI